MNDGRKEEERQAAEREKGTNRGVVRLAGRGRTGGRLRIVRRQGNRVYAGRCFTAEGWRVTTKCIGV